LRVRYIVGDLLWFNTLSQNQIICDSVRKASTVLQIYKPHKMPEGSVINIKAFFIVRFVLKFNLPS